MTDEQARWMQEQTRLQNDRQQMLEWRKAGTEAERLKAQQEEMGHKQEQMRKEITFLTTRLSEKEAELKVLQRLFVECPYRDGERRSDLAAEFA